MRRNAVITLVFSELQQNKALTNTKQETQCRIGLLLSYISLCVSLSVFNVGLRCIHYIFVSELWYYCRFSSEVPFLCRRSVKGTLNTMPCSAIVRLICVPTVAPRWWMANNMHFAAGTYQNCNYGCARVLKSRGPSEFPTFPFIVVLVPSFPSFLLSFPSSPSHSCFPSLSLPPLHFPFPNFSWSLPLFRRSFHGIYIMCRTVSHPVWVFTQSRNTCAQFHSRDEFLEAHINAMLSAEGTLM